jgi:hypothetical protein
MKVLMKMDIFILSRFLLNNACQKHALMGQVFICQEASSEETFSWKILEQLLVVRTYVTHMSKYIKTALLINLRAVL